MSGQVMKDGLSIYQRCEQLVRERMSAFSETASAEERTKAEAEIEKTLGEEYGIGILEVIGFGVLLNWVVGVVTGR